MSGRIRLTIVMTHPIQYYSPWFRFIAREAHELHLNVLYVTEPSAEQQGVGFEAPFDWDVPLKEGYESVVFRSSRESDRFSSARFFGLDAPGIGRAIAKLRPDAVLLSGWHSLALARAIVACRTRGIPLLYRGDSHWRGRERDLLPRFRSRLLLSLFDRFLCVGQRAREYLELLKVPSRYIFRSPHAVDNEFFASRAAALRDPRTRAEARREWGIAPEEFVILFLGKLESNKRPADLLRAVRLVGRRVRVLVVGSGPLQQQCVALASELGVSASFRGFLNQTEVPRAYGLSDCLAMPSERETWGLVVNEAMATGLPCVASSGVGCVPDLVEPGETGETFPVGDIEALAECLRRMLSELDAGRSRASRCRERVSRYSYVAATEGLVAACTSLTRP